MPTPVPKKQVVRKAKTTTPPPPRHIGAKHRWKEAWLATALDRYVRPHFEKAGLTIPEHVRVSTGWPSRGALAAKSRTIGQAWSNSCSADGVHEIIISVYLDDPIKILGVLIHEAIHVTVGVEAGHGRPFVDAMKATGLTGKPTATDESDELKATLAKWVDKLGPYPHAKLDATKNLKKQSTRLLKLECECGCKVRVTQKWIDEYGPEWDCPCGGTLEAEA